MAAMYPVRCLECSHDDDQMHPMPRTGGAPPFDPCVKCGGTVRRVVTPVAEVGTGNRMHQIVDHTLRPGFGSAVFNTRGEWEAEMKRQNVRPMEPGDAVAQAKNEAEHKRKGDEAFRQHAEQRIDKAIERALSERGGI
jgi:hypothetical protein